MQTRVLVLFGVLLVAAAGIVRADRAEQPTNRASFAAFPMQIGDWQGIRQRPFDDKVLGILGLTDYLTGDYSTRDRSEISLYVGYWSSQRQGETIHSPQNCLPGSGWEIATQATLWIPDSRHPGGPAVPVNRYIIEKGAERQLVLYWFQSHGRVVASEYWSKFYLVTDAVRMNRSDGAVVRVIAPVPGGVANAEDGVQRVAVRFVHDLLPVLSRFLPN
jgi:EpsI family protein